MVKYPDNLYTLVDNSIRLRFPYDDIYDLIVVTFPDIKITKAELEDIIIERIVKMI